jgi:enoyl-[acyl-carrier protein] reductase III
MSAALAGKVALVTGAARGIGRATALKLARAGCDIAANYYNSAEQAEALCNEVRALGRRAVAIQGSVGVPDSVDEIYAELGKHFERLDILVSNAASGVLKPTVEMTLKHWRWCMETNALALNLLVQRGLPRWRRRTGRHIVEPRRAARDARLRLHRRIEGGSRVARTRALAQELGPRGIRVNVVSAGVVDTDALAYFPNREELLANFSERTPAGPVLTPEDVAGAVYLLCLPEAAMINGHTLVVDGGFAISG